MEIAAVVAAGQLYWEAEEEAARHRRRVRYLNILMRKRRARRRALFACLSLLERRQPLTRYARINASLPILAVYFSEGALKPAFRMDRGSFNLLAQLLPRSKDHRWSHEVELLVTVYWLACGASYRATGDIFGMPVATICRVVHRTVDHMMTILHRVIHFPREDALEQVGAGFARLAGHEAFQRAVGAIDGSHIRVVPPAEPQKRFYINRKQFPSVVLQGVSDAEGRFIDIFVGSVHDSLVLRRSPLFKKALYPPQGFFLLGDGGYPCLQHPITIMTPYRQPLASEMEARYNRHHARGRNIVERTFGALKTRWRSIFLRALEVCPQFAPKVIAACCLLHNICVEAGDVLEEEEEEQEEEEEEEQEGANGGRDGAEEAPENVPVADRELSGVGLRARLVARVSAPQELAGCLNEHDYI